MPPRSILASTSSQPHPRVSILQLNDVPWSPALEVLSDRNPDLLLPPTSAPGSLHHISDERRAADVAPLEDHRDFHHGQARQHHHQVA
jgi:hypothetical protein